MPAPTTSGDRVLLRSLSQELAARGHRLDLLAFHPDDEIADEEKAREVFSHVETVPERDRSPLDYLIRLGHFFPRSADECWNPPMWHAVDRCLAATRYELVHFFGGVQVYEFRNQVIERLPNIIEPYECYTLALERALAAAPKAIHRLRIRARRRMARLYEARMFRDFGRVVLVTTCDEACLRGLAPDLATAVIPNGVDAGFFRPPAKVAGLPEMLFVGNLGYAPNAAAAMTLLTDILPRVEAEVAEVRATIVGPQPPARLRARRSHNAEITGWVSDIRPYLARAACFVSPLTTGAGIRNKILEAMAAGLPVVATPLSCEGIQVKDGESVLLGRTPAEMAAAVVRLLRDKDLRDNIAEAAQGLMRRDHTWSQVASRYEALYQDVRSEWAHAS